MATKYPTLTHTDLKFQELFFFSAGSDQSDSVDIYEAIIQSGSLEEKAKLVFITYFLEVLSRRYFLSSTSIEMNQFVLMNSSLEH